MQVGLQLQGVDVAVAEHALVHLDAGAAAVGLGLGERALRLAQQVVGGHVDAEGEADAGRQVDLPVVHDERLVQDAQQPVGQGAQTVEVLDVLGDDEELVGPQPDGGVLDAGAPAQPVGDLAEQQVAGLVAERLVDRPEPVDVEVHEPDLQPAAARQRDRVPQPVGQRAAVGQAGQRVDERTPDEVVLGPPPVGDVHHREDDELRVPVVVPDHLVRLHHPELGAVGPAQAPLAVEHEVRVQLRLTGVRREAEVAHRRVVGMGEQVDVAAGDALGRPAGQRAHHRVGHEHVTVEVHEGLGDRGRQEQGLEELAAVGEQGVDGPHALPGDPGAGRVGPRRLGGGKAHPNRVTHAGRESAEAAHGESWSSRHMQ